MPADQSSAATVAAAASSTCPNDQIPAPSGLRERLFAPLMARLDVNRRDLRANLAASQLVGIGLLRYVLRAEPIASAKPAEVVSLIAPTLQRYLTGKIEA